MPDRRPVVLRKPNQSALASGLALVACALPSANVDSPQPAATSPSEAEAEPKRKSKPARARRGPIVTEAELVGDGDRLRIHFSEAITPDPDIDPNDFRLSIAAVKIYVGYAYAYYYDPGELEGDALLEFTRMAGEGETVELYMSSPIPIAYCHEFERELSAMNSEPGVRADGGIFLHYSPGEVPISGTSGGTLAPFGAEWVLRKRRGGDEAYELYFEGPAARRALRDVIKVNCGRALPPGPV